MATTPKLRFGLFGTGHWAGQVHAAALTAAPEARFVGIWGRDRFGTAAIAAPYGIAAYDDADALIEDVDAVSIALPPDVQVPVAVRAARAGRHLLLERPLALSASGADELLGAVSNAGVASVVFLPAALSRLSTRCSVMMRPLEAGTAPAAPRCPPFSETAARMRNRYGGATGRLVDHGPHMRSLFLPVLGPAEEVMAVQGQHQTSHVLVRHAGGAVSALAVSLTVPKASIGLDVAFLGDSGVTYLPVAGVEPVPALTRAAGELARAAAGDSGTHACDVRFGWEVNALLSAAAESITTGRRVAVCRSS